MVHARKRQKITEGPTKSGYLNNIWNPSSVRKPLRPLRGSQPFAGSAKWLPPVRAFHRRDTAPMPLKQALAQKMKGGLHAHAEHRRWCELREQLTRALILAFLRSFFVTLVLNPRKFPSPGKVWHSAATFLETKSRREDALWIGVSTARPCRGSLQASALLVNKNLQTGDNSNEYSASSHEIQILHEPIAVFRDRACVYEHLPATCAGANRSFAQRDNSGPEEATWCARAGRAGSDRTLSGREGRRKRWIQAGIRMRQRRRFWRDGPPLRKRHVGGQRHYRRQPSADCALRGSARWQPETDWRRLPGDCKQLGRGASGRCPPAHGTDFSLLRSAQSLRTPSLLHAACLGVEGQSRWCIRKLAPQCVVPVFRGRDHTVVVRGCPTLLGLGQRKLVVEGDSNAPPSRRKREKGGA